MRLTSPTALWMLWFALLMLLLMPRLAVAVPETITEQVTLPGGTPAVGATVIIRLFDAKAQKLRREIITKTDAQGNFTVTIDATLSFPFVATTDYALIDAPGMALTFISLEDLLRREHNRRSEGRYDTDGSLALGTGKAFFGTVLFATNNPAPQAQVTLPSFSDYRNGYWPINDPGSGVFTPALITHTVSSGTWATRPVALVQETHGNGEAIMPGEFLARATQQAHGWAGETELALTFSGKQIRDPFPANDSFRKIILHPTLAVQGVVTRAADGHPVAGASVRLCGYPFYAISALDPLTTDAAGRFAFDDVPPALELFVLASHPTLAPTWVRVGETRLPVMGAAVTVTPPYHVSLALREWTTLSGRLVEVGTGKATSTEALQTASITSIFQDGYNDLSVFIPAGYANGTVQPNGLFMIRTAVGNNELRLNSPLYLSVERSLSVDVPTSGKGNVVLTVRKRPAYFVHLIAPTPISVADTEIFLRTGPGEGSQVGGVPSSGDWVQPAQKWGDMAEIRITSGSKRQELLPWTKITADPALWPQTIRLPTPLPLERTTHVPAHP